jgi:lipoyl(octanoyl) transferase
MLIDKIEFLAIDGLVSYQEGLDIMQSNLIDVMHCNKEGCLIFLEHESVYTTGRSTVAAEIDTIKNSAIPILETDRGGKITYHGPGQRVVYLILDLAKYNKDIRNYVSMLQQTITNTLSFFGIKAFTLNDAIGVWVKDHNNLDAKISSIGVRVKKWITYHGLAVNINNDLSHFKNISSCGIYDCNVTSMYHMGIRVSLTDFDKIFTKKFNEIFKCPGLQN